ncbi:hypothetical protein [Peristeroidobacter agariperforans]|uniref:hypothetical protein n=1 Tax=Peristeroidobacter agariperforans TaxID=268404 RepID=UPI00101BC03B|nr:hypothetical protein [Peristeroidobacter agariperforans]
MTQQSELFRTLCPTADGKTGRAVAAEVKALYPAADAKQTKDECRRICNPSASIDTQSLIVEGLSY